MTSTGFRSAQAAETAFYEAFENADHAAMMAVWGQDEDMECIHPLGERLTGPAAISESWRKMLSGRRRMQFRLSQVRRIQDHNLSVHILHENISTGDTQHPPVIATNIYRNNGAGWHMILHHASPVTEISGTSAARKGAVPDPTLH